MTCLWLAATAAGQSKANPRLDVVLRGCMQAEPRPTSASGRPVLIVTNARVSPDTASAAGSPTASASPRPILKEPGLGTTFILQGEEDDLSNYIGNVIEVRASIAHTSQKAPEAIGTSGSNTPPDVESEAWPRARVKEIHSVGDCAK
jgi:hypothetical protein